MSALLNELLRIPQQTGRFLVWTVFLHNPNFGVKLWLSAGFGISGMPCPMLFWGNDAGVIANEFVAEEAIRSNDDWMFLPELIDIRDDMSESYSAIYTDEFVRAFKIVRSHYIIDDLCDYEDDLLDDDDDCPALRLSQQIRTMAAILIDDDTWLGAIAAEPEFEFTTNQLVFAARSASILCFRFLSINNAEYSQYVFESAMCGGNEEIIQMCIEHGGDVCTREAMRESIRGGQTKIIEWLLNVHEMEVTFYDVEIALLSGHYEYVCTFESVLFQQNVSVCELSCDEPIPRNDDFRVFVEFLLSDSRVQEDLKNDIISHTYMIMYCDNVELVNKYQIDIGNFDSVLFALDYNCPNLLEAISQNGMINSKNDHGQTALFCYRSEMTFDILDSLMKRGVAVDTWEIDEQPLLLYAVSSDRLDIVMCICENGANLDIYDKRGETPLMNAIRYRNIDIMKCLIEHGANVECVNRSGATALFEAVMDGDKECIAILAEHGANLNALDQIGTTPLLRAALFGRISAVMSLVEHGVNIEERCLSSGETPLMCAAKYGRTEVVKYFLGQGANIEAADIDGKTALMYAAETDQLECIKCLVNNGANIEARAKNGETVLFQAASNRFLRVLKYFVTNGADLNTQRNDGQAALMAAANNGATDMVKCLVDGGADLNTIDNQGYTVLIHAAIKNMTNINLDDGMPSKLL